MVHTVMHKNKLNLSERMQVIADFVGKDEIVADIGTDHGYIPLWLLINDITANVILADVNSGPLERAAANTALYLENDGSYFPGLDMRLGSGIEVLSDGEADTVIIAGMGGLLIRDILSHDIMKTRSLKKLILQPRNNSSDLRRWMRSELCDFTIVRERVVKEGKKYSEIICAVRNESVTDEDASRVVLAADIEASLALPEDISLEIPCMYLADIDNTVSEYLKKRIQTEEKIIASIEKNGRNKASERQLVLTEKRLDNIKKMADFCRRHIHM